MRTLIILTISIVSLFYGISTAHSAEFTVDKRSMYHLGVSGGLGFSGGLFLRSQQRKNKLTDNGIILTSGTVSMIPGTFKEVIMDAYIDWGDMGFNAIGAYSGAWLGVKTGHYLFVSKKNDTVTLNYKTEF